MAQSDQDSRNLHDLAVDAQTDLQKLATGLAHAGAAPQAVSQLTHMAEILGQVVKVLGEGPALDNQQQGAPQAPGPQQAQPPAPGPAQPPAPAGGPPQQGPPSPAHQTLHAATHALHAAMIASKQAQQAR